MSTNSQWVFSDAYYGLRVDAALAKLLPHYSRSQLTQWLKEGKITVNNCVLKPKEKVNGGEVVDFLVDLNSLESKTAHCRAQNIPLNLIFEDDDVIVVNKPAGLVVHPGAGNKENTLINGLLYHAPCLEALPRAGIIHRLDKETTGLMVVAKNLPSHTHLTRQMLARQIQRHYITLVQGHIISGGEISTGYGRHPRNRLKMTVLEQGRQAITFYKVRKHYNYFFTLLDVQLQTGRTHQIRVHMNHINHPVVGDPLYNGRLRFPKDANDTLRLQLQQFNRQALHAVRLSFTHPITDTLLNFQAEIPTDFRALLNTLDAYVAELTR